MKCAICGSDDHKVIASAELNDAIRRRRQCGRCGHRWTTFERDEAAIAVLDREAILANIRSLEALVSQG